MNSCLLCMAIAIGFIDDPAERHEPEIHASYLEQSEEYSAHWAVLLALSSILLPGLAALKEVAADDENTELNWFIERLEKTTAPCALTDTAGRLQLMNEPLIQLLPEIAGSKNNASTLPAVLVARIKKQDKNSIAQDLATTMDQCTTTLVPQTYTIDQEVTVTVTATHVNGQNSLVWILKDHSLDSRLEERNQHLRKMQTVTRFAGGMAHEFNNILTAILGNLELMRSAPDAAVRDIASKIESAEVAGLRASQLIQELRRFASREVPTRETKHIPHIIRKARKLLGGTVGRHIDVSHSFEDEAQQNSLVNADQLLEAFLKLATNAAESIGTENGKIHFASRISKQGDRSFVQVDIQDTGHGMTATTVEHAFEPLYTTHNDASARGLGMSIAYGLVEEMDGDISIASTGTEGSVVRITLPLVEDKSDCIDNSDSGLSVHSMRVATVDSESSVRSVLSGMLELLGHSVTSYKDGTDLVSSLDGKHDFDAIFLDQVMPGMTGRATFQSLREIDNETPVIICSGTELRIDSFCPSCQTQPNGFLKKPFTMAELSSVLSTVEVQSR